MKVSEEGQITIPREIRKKVGMEPGTEVEITERDGEIVVTPKEDPKARMKAWIDKVRGTASPDFSTNEIMAMTRGED